MLIVKNLTLSLNGEPLLRNVDFSVAPGEILTLMGPSGSGKSTLFAWMVGALAENFRAAGELWLDNQRCDSLPTERRRIGILFQDALLFDHFSVGQNLLLALAADVAAPSAKPRSNRRWSAPVWRGFIRAIRPPFPAASGRGSACCAPCWPDRGRCCWMSRLTASTLRCAPIFAAGCSTNWRGRRSPRCWSRMMTRIRPPADAVCIWGSGNESLRYRKEFSALFAENCRSIFYCRAFR